ncbi:MAG: hypothetical protein AB7I19_16625 [Planctomycetota bacterium]
MIQLRSLLSVLALTATLAAQQAGFSTFGQACTVSGLSTPAISATGLPVLGSTFSIDYSGPNRATWPTELRPVFLYGIAPTNLSLDGMFRNQPAGCTLYVQPIDAVLMPPVSILFASSVALSVPNQPVLAGSSLVAQWACLNQTCLVNGCNANAVLTSDAASITLGF